MCILYKCYICFLYVWITDGDAKADMAHFQMVI